jgi:16S rRNA processing protein RimM
VAFFWSKFTIEIKMNELAESFTSDDGTFYLKLGSSRKPHGIKGGFSLYLYNTDETVLKNKSNIFLIPEASSSSLKEAGETFKVKSINIGNKSILYLDGITDRNQTEAMIPFAIYCDRKSFPAKKEGEVYLSDLIGLEAIDQESGESHGRVVAVSDNGVQDIIHIEGKEDFDIVYVDAFVHNINLDENNIIITKPVFE